MMKYLSYILIILLAGSLSANEKCIECHQANPPQGMEAAKYDIRTLDLSVHKDADCIDCHKIDPEKKHAGEKGVLCGNCHEDIEETYCRSPHQNGQQDNIDLLPNCVKCHGGHDILRSDDTNSITNRKKIIKICISCHEDEKLTSEVNQIPEAAMIKSYENSVHGKALLIDGNEEAPSCIDCHGSHSNLPSDNPDSPIYKTHIAETCGKCHLEEAKHFQESIHGETLSKGVLESPTCTNCHGEHNIKAHLDPESKVYATNVVKTCSGCHTSEVIVGKYGLKADRIETFKESFHGVAIEFGETKAANCASCHGVHDIYQQSHPKSLINKDNIQATCGKCHDDLPADFSQGTFHKSASDKESGAEYYVRNFYVWFITILIFGFIIYRVLEYKRRVKRVE